MEIKKENVLKAYENGCDEVKEVLKDLFPNILKKRSVKPCCDLRKSTGYFHLHDSKRDKYIGYLHKDGFKLCIDVAAEYELKYDLNGNLIDILYT